MVVLDFIYIVLTVFVDRQNPRVIESWGFYPDLKGRCRGQAMYGRVGFFKGQCIKIVKVKSRMQWRP